MTRRVSKKHNHSIKIKAKGERFFWHRHYGGESPWGAMLYAESCKKGVDHQ